VIADNSLHDGTTMPLYGAIDEVDEGSILLCVPGRLAYYYGEESIGGCWRWLVERRS
jgi:hypothetical protein